MAQLATFKARPLGVNRDLTPSEAPIDVYNEAMNLEFNQDRALRQRGYSYREPAPITAIESMRYYRIDGVNYWVYAGPDAVGYDDGTQNDITPLPYAPEAGEHSFTDLNGIPIWNNRASGPYYWFPGAANTMEELPGWPEDWRCRTMRSFKFFLLALGAADDTGDYDNQVRWSSSADAGSLPTEWEPSPTNDAGDMIFAGTPGIIVDGLSLRDTFVIYKPASTYLMQYIGNPFVFSQRKLFATSGLLARDCVAEWRGMHFCITEGDILAHDGNQGQSVADKVIRRDIFGDISAQFVGRSFVYHDPASLEMNLYWPSVGSSGWCDRRAIWNYRDDKWSLEEMVPDEVSFAGIGAYRVSGGDDTWADQTQAWEDWDEPWNTQRTAAVGDQTLLAFYAEVEMGQPRLGGTRAGQAPQVSATWASKDMGEPQSVKLIDRIWPNIVCASNIDVQIRVGVQDSYNQAVSWGPTQGFTVNRDEYVDVLQAGRLISVEVSSSSSIHWELAGFDIDYRKQGRF